MWDGWVRADRRAWAGLYLLPVVGCASGVVQKPAPIDCSPEGRLSYVQERMVDEYLWADQVEPVVLDASMEPAELMEQLRHEPPDRWSYVIERQEAEDWFDSGAYVGGGYLLRRDADGDIRFAMVYPDNPAADAGLQRGDRLVAVNGVSVEQLQTEADWSRAVGADVVGTVVQLSVESPGTAVRETLLTFDEVEVPPVMGARTFRYGDRTVLYFMLTTFVEPSHTALDDLFASTAAASVDTVVVDLRYNGGGLISVARHLAGLLAADHVGSVFMTYRHNAQHSGEDTETLLEAHPDAIQARDVVFLTTGSTASASEMVMFGLEPYVPVTQVGSTTTGKPVGMHFFEACDLFVAPITFQTGNRDALADWFDGLTPDCAAADDLLTALGAEEDPMLEAALLRLSEGQCPAGEPEQVRRSPPRAMALPSPSGFVRMRAGGAQ